MLEELDNRDANEYVSCCSAQHMGEMAVNQELHPLTHLQTLCSWSIHECAKPWDLLEAQLSSTDYLSPADSLFGLQTETFFKQQSWSGHQADTLMTAHLHGAKALFENTAQ